MPATRRRSAKSAAVTPVKKSTSAQVKVTKYTHTDEIKKVTETPTETQTPTKERRFATTRPAEPKISLEEYVSDFKVRMQINNYEVMEFLEDCKKFYNTVSPHVVKAFNYSKEKIEEWSATPKAEEKTED